MYIRLGPLKTMCQCVSSEVPNGSVVKTSVLGKKCKVQIWRFVDSHPGHVELGLRGPSKSDLSQNAND